MGGKSKKTSASAAGRVAIVTDALLAFGGADRLLKTLLKVFPDAQIYTSMFDPGKYRWIDEDTVHTTFIQRLPFHSYWRKHYMSLSPLGFEQFNFENYDTVISLSAGCAKGIITREGVFHLGVILTPPRNQWEGRMEDASVRRKRLGLHSITDSYLRVWDFEAGLRPDVLVAISKYIQKRVQKIYKRDSHVIFPGIDLGFWKPSEGVKTVDYYLVVSRLQEHKRIEIAVEACNELGRKLVVIGEGPERHRLERRSRGSVEFIGFVDDERVRDYMRKARGFLFPGVEDFGLAPIEAMACGCPVVAYNEGGLAETVIDGETGILYDGGNIEDLVKAMKRNEETEWDQKIVSKGAQKFSEESFLDQLLKVIHEERENKR